MDVSASRSANLFIGVLMIIDYEIRIIMNDIHIKTINPFMHSLRIYCPYMPLTSTNAIVDSVTLTNFLNKIKL